MSAKIVSDSLAINKNGLSSNVKAVASIAEAKLKGFLVLARYVSPDGRLYYSLGICPENNNN